MLPPGSWTPAFWQTYRFLTAPREYSKTISTRYGKISRFRGLNGHGVAIADPELARAVFAAEPDTFETAPVLTDIFGSHSVIAVSGPKHKGQRKLLNPRFHGVRIKAYLQVMQRVVRDHLEGWQRAREDGSVVVVHDLAQALTLDVIIETVFGDSLGGERSSAREIVRDLMGALSPTFVAARALRSSLYPPWRTFVRRRAAFDGWVDRMTFDRRARGDLGTDILGLLLEARYDDGASMPDVEIRDQLMTLLLAGYETTAIAFAWGVYWLLREPSTLELLRRSIDDLGPDPSLEALVRLPYLQAVIAETLRVEPIVTDVGRICHVPLEIGPFTIPAGELAIVNVSAILADPDLFPEPHRFRPDRFLGRGFHAGEFMPFGGGSRRCLGAAFAESELAIALAAVAADWELVLADDRPEEAVRRNITMGPKRGVRVRVLGRRVVPRGGSAIAG
jgi:cytochrome P450 family 110